MYILQWQYIIMRAMAFQITSVSIICLTVGSGADQRKYQSSTSLASVREIHRWRVNSPHKRPVMRKCFHLMTSSWYATIQCLQQSLNHAYTLGDQRYFITVKSHDRHGVSSYRQSNSLFSLTKSKLSKFYIPFPLWPKSTDHQRFPS